MKITYCALMLLMLSACNCNRVSPNYEGVLMTNYGRNGTADFKVVTGAQGWLGTGSTLYQVPMSQQPADPQQIEITAKDGGVFTVDPSYVYRAVRGKGVDIIFNYKHMGTDGDDNIVLDNVEAEVLNKLVLNAFSEEAGNYSTDSLMNNRNAFKDVVENRLKQAFIPKFFELQTLTSGLKPPASMAAAIERRNNAIQQAEQVKNELEVSRMNLEKAKIEAEENKVRASGLTASNLTEKWIEALRTTNNKVIITDGKTPVILGQ